MLPQRSSTNSQRRSSILKPPKSRQPFQDLDFNVSSPENSPNDTKKRRVSFAEKKHVKEFCDHKEQGTIWDSTYEEADQSVSKSTEISNENAGIRYMENVDVEINENPNSKFLPDNQDPINSEIYVIMDSNRVENSSKKVFLNSGTDLELTDVIPCSRGISNDSMSQTIICPEVELEITEAIGGIEPTISIKKIANYPHPSEIEDSIRLQQVIRNPEHTMLFDNSEGEMYFTEIISGGKTQAPIPCQDLEKNNSLIENQTIIFEDSIMELTLTESQTKVDIDQSRNVETNDPRDASNTNNEIIESGSNDRETSRANDKTLLFNDFSCDITEAVNTVIPQKLGANLMEKESLIAENSSNENNLPKKSDQTSTIPEIHGNTTIIFNDFGCEMTTAISTLKTNPAQDENIVERNDAEEIVPRQLLPTDQVADVEMEIEPGKSHSISLSSKPDLESSPKLISEYDTKTEFFNDSAMNFTGVITGEKDVQIEVQETSTLERNHAAVFDNCDVDVEVARCTLNSGLNLDERDNLLSTEIESNELSNNKKRKSIETEADIVCCGFPNSCMNKNSENDLVQSLAHDESNNITTNDNLSNTSAPNCSKRLKVTDSNTEEGSSSIDDDFLTVQSELLENRTNRTISQSPSHAQDLPEMQILIPVDVETEKNCITSLAEKSVEITEDSFVAAASNSCNDDQEKSIIYDNVESEAKGSPKTTEDDVSEEESSFIDTRIAHLNSDSETEALEMSRIYEIHRQSLTEKNNDVQSCLEPNQCLENNDDCCFVMFSEELEKRAKSEDCIWTIRSLDTKKVLIDFISKSLVIVINLETSEELTSPRIIQDIQIISLLRDSTNEDISMIHNILLKKFDLEKLKQLHRTTRDVLPLLETISERVKLLLNFMREFEKLEDLHLINRSGNRISFRLHSYKVQLVIKMTIDLEPLEDIGPNDVVVECILGNIRENDIKQLITSVKKDHRFLTNYIKDIKEYIALVVEK